LTPLKRFRGVLDPAKTDFGGFCIHYLGKYEAKCKTALGRESEPWVVLIDEKMKVENCVALSL
jgi:hypothetical protein